MFDVHFHWFPRDLIELARAAAPGNLMLRPPYEEVERSIKMMDEHGIRMSLISYPFIEPLIQSYPGSRVDALRKLNEKAAELRAQYPGRFVQCAAVDAMAGEEAVPELELAVKWWGCKALEIMTCYASNGDTVFPHERRFWPLYRRAEDLGIPVFVHPVRPPFWTRLPDVVQFMVGDWGFLLGDQLAIHLMACAGVFDAFPQLQFIFCQLGGFVPLTLGRTDLGHTMNRTLPTRVPSSADLKFVKLRDYNGRYYVDIHSSDSTAVRCAAENFGVDKLLYATDYPITPVEAGAKWHLDQVKGANLGARAVRAITWHNAVQVFGVE